MNDLGHIKLCDCGCGLPAPIAKQNDSRYGYLKGQSKQFIKGHSNFGKHHPCLGKKQTLKSRVNRSKSLTGREPVFSPYLPSGCIVIFSKKLERWYTRINDKTQPHALAVYKHFNGDPPFDYDVHHINGDASKIENDHPDNLMAIPRIWNRHYFPWLSKGFGVPETEVTKIYIKWVDKLTTDTEMFRMICREILLRSN